MPNKVGRVTVFANVAASTVAEGAAKTVRPMTMVSTDVQPIKVVAQCVVSDELVRAMEPEALSLLGKELIASVVTGSDAAFMTALAGQSAEGMGLPTWAGALDDVSELTRLVAMGAASRPYFIVTPELCKQLSRLAYENGVTTLGVLGGELMGIPVLVSDAQAADTISLIDASGLAIALGDIAVASSTQALVEMDTAPSSASGPSVTATSMVSMYQTNSVALRAERSFSIKPIRTGCYAHLVGVAIGDFSGSPAYG